MHGLSCFTAHGIFLHQGLNPCLLNWQVDFLLFSHWGSPVHCFFCYAETLYFVLVPLVYFRLCCLSFWSQMQKIIAEKQYQGAFPVHFLLGGTWICRHLPRWPHRTMAFPAKLLQSVMFRLIVSGPRGQSYLLNSSQFCRI